MPENNAAEPRFAVRHVQVIRALFAALAAAMITFSPDHSAAVGLAVFSGFAIATGLIFSIAAWLTYPTGRRAPAVLLALVTLAAGMVTGLGPLRTEAMFFVAVIAWAAFTGTIELVAGWRTVRRASADKSAARGPAGDRPIADAGSDEKPAAAPASAPQSAAASSAKSTTASGQDSTTASTAGSAPALRRGALPAPWRAAGAEEPRPVTAQERSEARDAIVVGILGLALAVALLVIPAGYRLDYAIEEAGQSFTLTGLTIAVGGFGGYAAIVAVYLGIAGLSPRRPSAGISAGAAPSAVDSAPASSPQKSPGGSA